jgi:hypothetical protein
MATKPTIRFQRAEDMPQLNRRIEDFSKQVSDCPLLSGRLIEDISLTPGGAATTVEHKLGRMPRGWIVTRQEAVGVAMAALSASWDENNLYIWNNTAGPTFVSVWVF